MASMLRVSQIAKDDWFVKYESDLVKVEVAFIYLVNVSGSKYEICSHDTYGAFNAEVWRVFDFKTKRGKVFSGETAWSDARRFASDLDFGAWSIDEPASK